MANLFSKDENVPHIMPVPEGTFRAVRKHDIHLGVDIYMPEGTEVIFPSTFKLTATDAVVRKIETFTGPNSFPPTPWWNETKSVILQCNNSGRFFIFGEIETSLKVGDIIKPGDVVGTVSKVLKTYKGIPQSMLHFEIWNHGYETFLQSCNFGLCSVSLEWNSKGFILSGEGFDGNTKEHYFEDKEDLFECSLIGSYQKCVDDAEILLQDDNADNLEVGVLYEVEKDLQSHQYSYGFSYHRSPRKGEALVYLGKSKRKVGIDQREETILHFVNHETAEIKIPSFRLSYFLKKVG